jgi:GntR family transcriptional regulator, transcriptional repressor for pyruvate dehydrogenase complex
MVTAHSGREARVTRNPVFGAVTRDPSLVEKVVDSLLRSISSGDLRPGDGLPSERDLSEQFAVSRTIIRESLRVLQAKGLIDVRSGRSAVVTAMPASHITETIQLFVQGATAQELLDEEKISEVRFTLEMRMVELACERATEADLTRMQEAVNAMAAASDVEEASAQDVEFHRLIASATYNALFAILLDSIGAVLMEIRRRSLSLQGRQAHAVEQHQRILDALVARDADLVRKAMSDHLLDSRRFYATDPGGQGRQS